MTDSFLQFDSIRKSFPGVQALSDISFGVEEGTIHALLGENGAGKSTLLKILSGAYTPDSGAIRIGQHIYRFKSTAEAIQAGIAVIYQELHLVPQLTVAENLFLGRLPNRRGIIDAKKLREDSLQQLSRLKEPIDPFTRVGSLPIAQHQMIEIAKALSRNAKILAFDEPTSSLSDREVTILFSMIRELKRKGCIILYVTHRLQEVFDLCDAATVFRDGRRIETIPDIPRVDRDYIVQRMVGRSIRDIYHYTPRSIGAPALEVKNLMGPGLSEPVTLSVAQGEIVGIFGLVGAGRTELLKLIYGAVRPTSGQVFIQGQEITQMHPADSIRKGMVFCPEDRKKEGIIPIRSTAENINLSIRRLLSRWGFLIQEKREKANAESLINQLTIKPPTLSRLVKYLSGGNQQKVILARWMSEPIKVMLLDEPTRGIDVGSKSEIYGILSQLAKDGVGILFVSSELPEILGISDRIIVMREGRKVATLACSAATESMVLSLALPSSKAMYESTPSPNGRRLG